jgi:hypothetical protein
VSVQYGPHVWTILLITVNEKNNGWGWWNYLWLDMDTLLRWIVLITSSALFHWGRAEGSNK